MTVKCTEVVDGPQRASLERQAVNLWIQDVTSVSGALPLDRVMALYKEARLAALASQTEGLPKTIVKTMAFGLLCIGSEPGLILRMVGEGRGLLAQPCDLRALATAFAAVVGRRQPSLWKWGAKRACGLAAPSRDSGLALAELISEP